MSTEYNKNDLFENVSSPIDNEAAANILDTAIDTSHPIGDEVTVIYDKDDYRGRITIFENSSKLKAYMKITPAASEEKYSLDDITFILSNLHIITGIQEREISDKLALISPEQGASDYILIAEGRSPVHGEDGKCDILFDQNIPYIEKGQILLRITEPIQGTPGENIYGELIHPNLGKLPHVAAGNHVIEGENNEFSSEIFGKVTFTDHVLSVEKVLEIKASRDGMEASLTYTGKAKLSRDIISEELYANNIVSGIDDHAIDFIVTSCTTSEAPIKDFIVACGTLPQKGRDGAITYLFHESKGISLTEYVENGMIIRGTKEIKSVDKDHEIAYITPHIDPSPGKNIYGKIIPVQKVKKVKLRPGKNVRASDDGLHFFAEVGGRPLVEGDKLSISDVLTIPGDVDYTVGNIDFDGIVEINGDILDGFKIKASKTIIIKGVVGACDIEVGLDIQIQGGCNGQNKARIICGGNVEAKYINEFYVQARGDILVKNEVVSSTIFSLGRVFVKFGSIRGGTIYAKKGIESLDIGNDMGVKTTLVPGSDFEVEEKCKQIDDQIIAKNNEMEELTKRIAPLLKNKELISKLPEDAQQKLKETVEYLKKLREEKVQLNKDKNGLIAEVLKDANPEVVVFHYIYHGVILKIGKSRRVISSMLEGPLRLYEENERITVEPYSAKQ